MAKEGIGFLVDNYSDGLVAYDTNFIPTPPITAIDNLEERENISFYPNPTKSTINVKMLNSEAISYEITDLWGKELRSGRIHSGKATIEVRNIPNGIYHLKIIGPNITEIHRFVKN